MNPSTTPSPDLAHALVSKRLKEHISIFESFLDQSETIAGIAGVIAKAIRAGGKVLTFGNGGSAADAQHFAGELVGRYYFHRAALPAISLTVNTSNLTAIANDYSFDRVFARQVEALGSPGDVAVGISTSGRSPNVIAALREARGMGLATVGLTGERGGSMKADVDVCLAVPSSDTPRIQEAHIAAIHIICELVERDLCETDNSTHSGIG